MTSLIVVTFVMDPYSCCALALVLSRHAVPHTRTVLDSWMILVAGLKLWNSLPISVHHVSSLLSPRFQLDSNNESVVKATGNQCSLSFVLTVQFLRPIKTNFHVISCEICMVGHFHLIDSQRLI